MPISIKRSRAPSHTEIRRPTPKISMPVILQSSTNLHLHEMMDLATAQKMMAARGPSEAPTPSSATEPDLTDGSSAASSPAVEHNHLSTYFPGPAGIAAKAADTSAPAIPKRVPSHSKREHERLARKRSLRGSNGPEVAYANNGTSTPNTGSSTPQRTSFEMVGVYGTEAPPKTPTAAKHRSPRLDNMPFSPELERLTEAVEEQIRWQPEVDEDTKYMRKHGLVKIDAAAYCSEIGDCYIFPSTPFDAGFTNPDMGAWI